MPISEMVSTGPTYIFISNFTSNFSLTKVLLSINSPSQASFYTYLQKNLTLSGG
jgi:hypothetical protein